MITGIVKGDEGLIRLTIKGPSGREREIDAVIDTGYTASLSLPPTLVASLVLRWQTFDRAILADGSEVLFDVYEATVVWDGKARRLLVDQADSEPLVGMGLLRGCELRMEVRSRGKITIMRLA